MFNIGCLVGTPLAASASPIETSQIGNTRPMNASSIKTLKPEADAASGFPTIGLSTKNMVSTAKKTDAITFDRTLH
jgi:hypothetical protein